MRLRPQKRLIRKIACFIFIRRFYCKVVANSFFLCIFVGAKTNTQKTMKDFNYYAPTEVVFGKESEEQVAHLVSSFKNIANK